MNIAFSDTSKQDNDINDSLYTSHIHTHTDILSNTRYVHPTRHDIANM